jgi:hypothetical protein
MSTVDPQEGEPSAIESIGNCISLLSIHRLISAPTIGALQIIPCIATMAASSDQALSTINEDKEDLGSLLNISMVRDSSL